MGVEWDALQILCLTSEMKSVQIGWCNGSDYLMWEEGQDCASVYGMVVPVIEVCGLKDGNVFLSCPLHGAEHLKCS